MNPDQIEREFFFNFFVRVYNDSLCKFEGDFKYLVNISLVKFAFRGISYMNSRGLSILDLFGSIHFKGILYKNSFFFHFGIG